MQLAAPKQNLTVESGLTFSAFGLFSSEVLKVAGVEGEKKGPTGGTASSMKLETAGGRIGA